MNNNILKILINEDEIKEKVKELGKAITEDYKDKDLMIIGILKGCVIFLSDLVREIDLPLTMDFMVVSSYGSSTKSSGVVRIIKDLEKDITGKDVLIVEDIVDTGLTLERFREVLAQMEPAEVKVATCLLKPDAFKNKFPIDYQCFSIPNEFVVGYGLDYDGLGRNSSDIYKILEA